ncbi:D-alanine--poly(phosphoribitol) ligase subunit DltC [Vagococcus xieshaowenii]|uniref:D-alanyl carrier protein n=1 Tax=Vagococcus xieshaowenii TaxID=2562451 RepID=A0A4Z0DCI8_9ENTE|nr:D-alanine--poly(phosphoribitol) ligase subunit DltC [Vagococcus xieshaowenii]QCA29529.1 D-alanine--poly(phosphoribitol) ligase subunit DltC [Vagococcus xieshaowenii]TFZ42645.1 D-alanine--poly(phosphoribitol) ligase subunit DltC [Vagococcus xieshaowenii]
MTTETMVLNILEDITGAENLAAELNTDLFDEGILDSLASVQLLVELENQCGVAVPISEFDRSEWGTPQQIIDQVTQLQN